jgi:hypothetical protein
MKSILLGYPYFNVFNFIIREKTTKLDKPLGATHIRKILTKKLEIEKLSFHMKVILLTKYEYYSHFDV